MDLLIRKSTINPQPPSLRSPSSCITSSLCLCQSLTAAEARGEASGMSKASAGVPHLQHFKDGLLVHGLLVVGGLVEGIAEGA